MRSILLFALVFALLPTTAAAQTPSSAQQEIHEARQQIAENLRTKTKVNYDDCERIVDVTTPEGTFKVVVTWAFKWDSNERPNPVQILGRKLFHTVITPDGRALSGRFLGTESEDWVLDLFSSSDGIVYVVTQEGVREYNRARDDFTTRTVLHDPRTGAALQRQARHIKVMSPVDGYYTAWHYMGKVAQHNYAPEQLLGVVWYDADRSRWTYAFANDLRHPTSFLLAQEKDGDHVVVTTRMNATRAVETKFNVRTRGYTQSLIRPPAVTSLTSR